MKPFRTSSADKGSPFDGPLRHQRPNLAPALVQQFFGADRDHQVRLDGVMHRVWHRHSWLWPLFTVLAWADIFFPETGRDVPASMLVTQTPEGVDWRRTFWFPRVRRFNATMTYRSEPPSPLAGEGRGGGCVIERVGPRGILEIPWQLRAPERDRIEITTGPFMLRIGRARFSVPGLMQVAVRAVERVVDGAIHVELVLHHRLLGDVFGYDGTFTARREGLEAAEAEPIDTRLRRFAPWFYAAAIYNLVWGSLGIIRPAWFFDAIGMSAPSHLVIWQALAMMVLVYAPAYWWIGNDPVRHRHLVVIALLGKLLGPLGFAWALRTNTLPLSFGLTILTNDLVWWPAFIAFLWQAASGCGGWRNLLLGR